MAIPLRGLTLDEFLELPEAEPALEFWDGVVVQKVSPQNLHGRMQYSFAERVNRIAEPLKLAMAFTETRATFGGRSPVPDVVVYRWERIPRDARGKLLRRFIEPPDIAVEIVSPEQSIATLIEKCRRYIELGVRIALLIEPEDEWVMLFRRGAEPRRLRGADRIDLDSVLPGFELTAEELFEALYDR
jgi:Uma2 family endonuclease